MSHPIITPEFEAAMRVKYPPFRFVLWERRPAPKYHTTWEYRCARQGLKLPDAGAAIVDEVLTRHPKVTALDVIGPSAKVAIVAARQEVMWALYEARKPCGRRRWSVTVIGRMLGARDHSTISYGIKRHLQRMAKAAAD